MKRLIASHLSPALVISILALIVAASGTSLAAAPVSFLAKTLGLNATQKRQAKSIADQQIVAKAKGLTVLHASTAASATTATQATNATNAVNAAQATSATNATNAVNAQTATSASTAANATSLGGVAAGSFLRIGETLPSGATETGVWGGQFAGTASKQFWGAVASFPVPLASGTGLNSEVVPSSSASGTHCPGLGRADAGYLCVYVTGYEAHVGTLGVYNPEASSGAADSGDAGFGVDIESSGSGTVSASGDYAVTAP